MRTFEYTFIRIPDSTCVAKIYWNVNNHQLFVELQDSGLRRIYNDVSAETVQDFSDAPSVGRYWNEFFRHGPTDGSYSTMETIEWHEHVDFVSVPIEQVGEPIVIPDESLAPALNTYEIQFSLDGCNQYKEIQAASDVEALRIFNEGVEAARQFIDIVVELTCITREL